MRANKGLRIWQINKRYKKTLRKNPQSALFCISAKHTVQKSASEQKSKFSKRVATSHPSLLLFTRLWRIATEQQVATVNYAKAYSTSWFQFQTCDDCHWVWYLNKEKTTNIKNKDVQEQI